MPPIPVIIPPSGYGHYGSISYPGGGWAFAALTETASDPCSAMLQSSPGGTIQRAGLWSVKGENNVLVRSAGGEVRLYRGTGSQLITAAFEEAKGKKGCVFTVAPVALPIFGLPYGKTNAAQSNASADVSVGRGFDYNVYRQPMDVTQFGQQALTNHPSAHSVDRMGRQRCYLKRTGEHVVPGEPAYDWLMPAGKPIVAVADGIVREARARDVSSYGCGPDKQNEIYIEHQVGSGTYAERFVSYYAHMSKLSVSTGDTVTSGQTIGEAGNTGCSDGNHLHLGVMRLTNLSGQRSYTFQTTPDGYGINGVQGIIDPFGWSAPKHIDPWAWRFLGDQNDPYLGTVKDPGAFSINVWRPGEAPGSDW